MKRRSLFICFLVLAQSMLAGDRHPTMQQATPTASIGLARFPKEIRARMEEMQTRITRAGKPFSEGTSGNRPSLVPGHRDPQAIREETSAQRPAAAPALSNTLNAQEAPVDTVYVWSPTITHRYLYSYDTHGTLVSLVIQYESMGKWVDQEKVSWTYDSRNVWTSIVRESVPLGTIIERTVESTYGQGRQSSRVYEAMSANTCRLELVFRDSTTRDDRGREIFSQTEQWEDGVCLQGTRLRTEHLGHMNVEESQYWTPQGWQNMVRTTNILGRVPEQPYVIVQRWSGSAWIDDLRQVWMENYTEGDLSRGTRTEVWEQGKWTGVLRSISHSEDGLNATTISELWAGDHWDPHSRTDEVYNEQFLPASTTVYDWQDGWIKRFQSSSAFEPDGAYRLQEEHWSNGQLILTLSARSVPGGNWLWYESQYWNNGVATNGWRETRTLDPDGRELELLHSLCQSGTWEWDDRYAMAYDAKGRLVSVDHFAWEEFQWVNSARTRNSGPPSWPDISGGNSSGFTEFSRISFGYRDAATAVEPDMATLPATTELMQNYPNPFNPSTTIPFSVAQSGFTALAIYDVLGREVAQLVNEWKEPGNYEVRFDASGLASGMYVSTFTSGAVTQTRKLVLVR